MKKYLKINPVACFSSALLMLAFSLVTAPVLAQRISLIGAYEQDVIELPTGVTESENDLVISQDPASSKKIWLSNLLQGGRIYALAVGRNDEAITYRVPVQSINGYRINVGWVIYDMEENQLTVSINNGVDKVGKPGKVTIGSDGNIDGGGVKIGKKGSISAPGVEIDKGGIKVDYSKALGGISYVGHKAGTTKKDDGE